MKKWPRWARILLWVVVALAIVLFVASLWIESIVAAAIEEALGGTASVGSVSGLLSSEIILGDVEVAHRDDAVTHIGAASLTLRFEGPVMGRRGALREVIIDGPTLSIDVERFGDDAGTENRRKPPAGGSGGPAELDLDLIPQKIRLTGGKIDVHLGGGWVFPVVDLDIALTRKDLRFQLDRCKAGLFRGSLSSSGTIPIDRPEALAMQVRVANVDLAHLLEAAPFKAPISSGSLAGFVDVRYSKTGLVGAGFVSASQSHLWNLPVFSGILDTLGLAAGKGDYVKTAKARFHIEADKLHFKELTAVGSPLSLFGNGWMALDGSTIKADFIPRIGSGLTNDLPVIGKPSQLLLDVAKGVVIEVQLRGSRSKLDITTLPVPIITKPMQAFFDLVSGR